jgi:hypothetical protein
MKYLFIAALFALLYSCGSEDLTFDSQEIIQGKISATEKGGTGRYAQNPKIWVQSPTQTRQLDIPFEYEGKWKVGDTCLLIVQKYIKNTKK